MGMIFTKNLLFSPFFGQKIQNRDLFSEIKKQYPNFFKIVELDLELSFGEKKFFFRVGAKVILPIYVDFEFLSNLCSKNFQIFFFITYLSSMSQKTLTHQI